MKSTTTSFGLPRVSGKPSSDAFVVQSWDQTILAVLSDGAGSGEPAREAALRAVATLPRNYRARPRNWAPGRALLEMSRVLNTSLYEESYARFERSEMVATLAVVAIEGDRLYGINVGDSPVYHWRAGKLTKLSTDHVDLIQKHVLINALGIYPVLEPAAFSLEIMDGDIILLCSDGVSNHLPPDALSQALEEGCSARSIVQTAMDSSRPESVDDMSAVVIRIHQTGRLRAMTQRLLEIPTDLIKGQRVDGYDLLRSFQGTSRVWLAAKDANRVVMKFAPPEAKESVPHLDAFTRETWNATRVESDYFVKSHEPLGQTMRYYLMEFIDAPNLQVVLQQRMLSVDSAVGLGKFLTQACQTLLKWDLAHGDIKPENILCIGDYTQLKFKLVDLGSSSSLFATASRAGTPSYLAPERFHASPVCERTEIFAIGVTLYQALTNTLPFGEIERFQTPTFRPHRRISKINPNVPLWLESIVDRALAIDPEWRYQHYSEMIFDLENPAQVRPCLKRDAPLLERNPLGFYRTGFYLLLVAVMYLGMKLLSIKR